MRVVIFIEQLTKWELDMSGCERGTSERLPCLLKDTRFITKTSGTMYRADWRLDYMPEEQAGELFPGVALKEYGKRRASGPAAMESDSF